MVSSATDHSNDRNHHLRGDGTGPDLKTDGKRNENKFWARNNTLRSKSLMEAGNYFRHPGSVLDPDDGGGGGDRRDWGVDGMIDFISTDAPDDTVIKPSVLRFSMRSRRRTKNIAADTGPMYRRAASLREPRGRSTGRPLQASSSVRTDADRLLKEAGNRATATGGLRSVIDEHYFADGNSNREHRSKSELGVNRASVKLFSHSPQMTNSPKIESKVKDFPPMEHGGSDPIIPREGIIYQRRLRYERPSVGIDKYDDSYHMTSCSSPKSQENVIVTTDAVVTPTSHNLRDVTTTAKHGDEWNRWNRRMFADDDDDEYAMNRKHVFEYEHYPTRDGESAADTRHSKQLRGSFGDEISPPTDYDTVRQCRVIGLFLGL